MLELNWCRLLLVSADWCLLLLLLFQLLGWLLSCRHRNCHRLLLGRYRSAWLFFGLLCCCYWDLGRLHRWRNCRHCCWSGLG
jgi:hypothetical protein